MGIAWNAGRFVERAYAAAFDETRWSGWTEELGEALGGVSSVFHVADWPDVRIRHCDLHRFPAGALDEYLGGMAAADPQIAYVSGLTASRIYDDRDHLDRGDPATADYMKWSIENARADHHLSAIVMLDGGRLRTALSIHRKPGDGPTPATERARFTSIFGQVTGAMQLCFEHGEKLTEAYWAGLLTARDEPALLIDERGTACRWNPDVDAVIAAGDGIGLAAGRLIAASGRDDERLQAIIGRAIARTSALASGVTIRRPSGRAPYLVTAYPLPRSSRMYAPFEAAALLSIVDPSARPMRPAGILQEAFGFTKREAQFAVLLLAGHSVGSAAATLDLKLPTARIHLRNVFAKTGTNRQADLLRLLGRLTRTP